MQIVSRKDSPSEYVDITDSDNIISCKGDVEMGMTVRLRSNQELPKQHVKEKIKKYNDSHLFGSQKLEDVFPRERLPKPFGRVNKVRSYSYLH